MYKKTKDLIAGDVIRTAFGDDNNIVTVVVDNVIIGKGCYDCNIKCHYYGTDRFESMWGGADDDCEVIDSNELFVSNYLKPLLQQVDNDIEDAFWDGEIVTVVFRSRSNLTVMPSVATPACITRSVLNEV